MRVKLSYSADEETVLQESGNLVGLCGGEIQRIIDYFSELQAQLRGEEKKANVAECLETIEEFRNSLLNVDVRLSEVGEIVRAYGEYQLRKTEDDTEESVSSEASP